MPAEATYHPDLVAYIADRLDSADAELAEDIAQEMWVMHAHLLDRVADACELDGTWFRQCADAAVERHQEATADEALAVPYSELSGEICGPWLEFSQAAGLVDAGYERIEDEPDRGPADVEDVGLLPGPDVEAVDFSRIIRYAAA